MLPKLIHYTASNGEEQAVLVLNSSKQKLSLLVQQRKEAVSISVVYRTKSKRATSGIRKKHKSVLVFGLTYITAQQIRTWEVEMTIRNF